jgi:hypothetical protein
MNIANNNTMATVLGVSTITPTQNTDAKEIVINNGENKAESDYDYARQNLYGIIERGQEALDDMIEFAKQAQHPRAFEVVGGLISNLVDANEKLLDLNKKIKDLRKDEEDKNPQTVNNNLFVGSTADLQKLFNKESVKDEDAE